ncbi:hypothetical protein C8R43DRAFT_988552 [Mycena crocata]|nr:hypothetical protein C8R43DRAFT_988552 [Mycena crocata]
MYLDLLICSFRTNTTKYPPPSNHPSRPSMDQLDDMLTDAIQASGADHGSARTRALARDGYHCMLSNTIDKQSFQKHPAVKELGKKSGAAVHPIHACHIFNESLLERIDPTDEYPHQRHHGGAALRILKMFGLSNVVERLMTISINEAAAAAGVHDLINIISLHHSLHAAFDDLKVAFEPTADGVPNKYDIFFAYPELTYGYLGLKHQVELTNFAGNRKFKSAHKQLPLPDPQLLALHAVCARVAHMSGAGEVLDEFDREVEEMRVFARDGASANLLYMKLSPFVSAAA